MIDVETTEGRRPRSVRPLPSLALTGLPVADGAVLAPPFEHAPRAMVATRASAAIRLVGGLVTCLAPPQG